MTRGGKRQGAGRPVGVKNKKKEITKNEMSYLKKIRDTINVILKKECGEK
jgi:hypothetical protein